jgi:hypothetical protein
MKARHLGHSCACAKSKRMRKVPWTEGLGEEGEGEGAIDVAVRGPPPAMSTG